MSVCLKATRRRCRSTQQQQMQSMAQQETESNKEKKISWYKRVRQKKSIVQPSIGIDVDNNRRPVVPSCTALEMSQPEIRTLDTDRIEAPVDTFIDWPLH